MRKHRYGVKAEDLAPCQYFNSVRILSAENGAKIRAARDGLDEVLAKLEEAQDGDRRRALNRLALYPGVVKVIAAQGTDQAAEMFIYGDIGGWFDGVTAEDIAKELAAIEASDISVNINSGGGVVFDGIAIYNALAQHSARITVNITGLAASIASVIAMAGDEIRIFEGAHIMVHKPWSFAIGDALSMRKEADILDSLEKGILDIYEARTGKDRQELETMIAAETWLKGQDAVDAGFADVMVPGKKKNPTKSNLLNFFQNAPLDLVSAGESLPEIREFERLLRDGEGLSHSKAKRISALAARVRRDGVPQPLRDEGCQITASDLGRLTNLIQILRYKNEEE